MGGKTGTSTVFLAISLYLVTACIKKKLIPNIVNTTKLLFAFLLVVSVESGLSLFASMTGMVKMSSHIYDLVDIYSPILVVFGMMTFLWFFEQSIQIGKSKYIGGGYERLQNILFRYICFTKIPISDI